MSHGFIADADKKFNQRNVRWYKENLLKVLEKAKEKRVRDIDVTIAIAKELLEALDEPVEKPVVVPLRNVVPYEDDSLMKPIENSVLDLLYKSTEKGSGERYFHERYRKLPEDRFFFRVCSSWDYGWQQKQSRMRARDVNRGRCAILKHTFYRKNNLAPDPGHYSEPMGGEVSICSEYHCIP